MILRLLSVSITGNTLIQSRNKGGVSQAHAPGEVHVGAQNEYKNFRIFIIF
jgi:hypothetical protein